jgi:hypothetical protein
MFDHPEKTARPTQYTPETSSTICGRLVEGETLREICREPGTRDWVEKVRRNGNVSPSSIATTSHAPSYAAMSGIGSPISYSRKSPPKRRTSKGSKMTKEINAKSVEAQLAELNELFGEPPVLPDSESIEAYAPGRRVILALRAAIRRNPNNKSICSGSGRLAGIALLKLLEWEMRQRKTALLETYGATKTGWDND